ncbi:MAG: hypothetical protein EZS28_005492 [Streblomastix strix]|uniref:CUE domain-containing protein n=1 Tax=Streblomastix strix TaxID=222440 RepID=A0A5J4WXL6_9EUKA|nr:MAG: hypothetical protein EZS28_005492 [Streblomastix strix]
MAMAKFAQHNDMNQEIDTDDEAFRQAIQESLQDQERQTDNSDIDAVFHHIKNVFPDIDDDFLLENILNNIEENNIIQKIVDEIAEMGENYPKLKKQGPKRATAEEQEALEQQHQKHIEKLRQEYQQVGGSFIECPCCFGDYPCEELVQCDQNGHLICKSCVKQMVCAGMENGRVTVSCAAEADCKGAYNESVLLACLSEDDMFRLDKLRLGDNLNILNKVKDIESGEEQLRKFVEQRMSAAAIRICPKCQKELIKEEGCGAALCYNCRMPLDPKKPYDHFKDPPI